ncbi:MAG TPA: hypothetical protein VHM02_06115, partial [Thermoanaerobaculia bacterium]|nr:hypothetical protein [Thermoanaerobaculia bacterium]
ARLAEERDRLAARLAEERSARTTERERWAARLDETTREGEALRDRGERLSAEVERLRRSALPRATAVSYLLTAAQRSAAGVPELALAPETGRVHLQLDTGVREPHPAFRARLYAPPGGALAWSRTGIPPASGAGAGGPTVELDLPAEIFVSGRYRLELEGIPAGGGEPELIGDFQFEVVRR